MNLDQIAAEAWENAMIAFNWKGREAAVNVIKATIEKSVLLGRNQQMDKNFDSAVRDFAATLTKFAGGSEIAKALIEEGKK